MSYKCLIIIYVIMALRKNLWYGLYMILLILLTGDIFILIVLAELSESKPGAQNVWRSTWLVFTVP